MDLFGGSYPPGCNSVPGDEPYYCEVCGRNDFTCICPECPECGDFGNPDCYNEHGLVRSQKQIESKEEMDKYWEYPNYDGGGEEDSFYDSSWDEQVLI